MPRQVLKSESPDDGPTGGEMAANATVAGHVDSQAGREEVAEMPQPQQAEQPVKSKAGGGFDAFFDRYVETALWADGEYSGKKTVGDIRPSILKQMELDCRKFVAENEDDISEDYGRAGHDFWLTRNDHGAGFWDGDWPEDVGERLTEAAKKYGEFFLGQDDDDDGGDDDGFYPVGGGPSGGVELEREEPDHATAREPQYTVSASISKSNQQWAIFNDDSADWSEDEAVEAGFYSREEGEEALSTSYSEDDGCVIHEVEDPEEEEEDDNEDDEEDKALFDPAVSALGVHVGEVSPQWEVNYVGYDGKKRTSIRRTRELALERASELLKQGIEPDVREVNPDEWPRGRDADMAKSNKPKSSGKPRVTKRDTGGPKVGSTVYSVDDPHGKGTVTKVNSEGLCMIKWQDEPKPAAQWYTFGKDFKMLDDASVSRRTTLENEDIENGKSKAPAKLGGVEAQVREMMRKLRSTTDVKERQSLIEEYRSDVKESGDAELGRLFYTQLRNLVDEVSGGKKSVDKAGENTTNAALECTEPGKGIVRAKGSLKAMQKLVKENGGASNGWYLVATLKPVGETVGGYGESMVPANKSVKAPDTDEVAAAESYQDRNTAPSQDTLTQPGSNACACEDAFCSCCHGNCGHAAILVEGKDNTLCSGCLDAKGELPTVTDDMMAAGQLDAPVEDTSMTGQSLDNVTSGREGAQELEQISDGPGSPSNPFFVTNGKDEAEGNMARKSVDKGDYDWSRVDAIARRRDGDRTKEQEEGRTRMQNESDQLMERIQSKPKGDVKAQIKEGILAARAGKQRSDNPYRKEDDYHGWEAWLQGYKSGLPDPRFKSVDKDQATDDEAVTISEPATSEDLLEQIKGEVQDLDVTVELRPNGGIYVLPAEGTSVPMRAILAKIQHHGPWVAQGGGWTVFPGSPSIFKEGVPERLQAKWDKFDAEEAAKPKSKAYNGYPNYETWNVNLWIMNDEPVYRAFQNLSDRKKGRITAQDVRSFVEEAMPDGTPDFETMGGAEAYSVVDWQHIADSWNEEYEGEDAEKLPRGRGELPDTSQLSDADYDDWDKRLKRRSIGKVSKARDSEGNVLVEGDEVEVGKERGTVSTALVERSKVEVEFPSGRRWVDGKDARIVGTKQDQRNSEAQTRVDSRQATPKTKGNSDHEDNIRYLIKEVLYNLEDGADADAVEDFVRDCYPTENSAADLAEEYIHFGAGDDDTRSNGPKQRTIKGNSMNKAATNGNGRSSGNGHRKAAKDRRVVDVFGDEIAVEWDGNVWVAPTSNSQHSRASAAMKKELESYFSESGEDTDDEKVSEEIDGFVSQMYDPANKGLKAKRSKAAKNEGRINPNLQLWIDELARAKEGKSRWEPAFVEDKISTIKAAMPSEDAMPVVLEQEVVEEGDPEPVRMSKSNGNPIGNGHRNRIKFFRVKSKTKGSFFGRYTKTGAVRKADEANDANREGVDDWAPDEIPAIDADVASDLDAFDSDAPPPMPSMDSGSIKQVQEMGLKLANDTAAFKDMLASMGQDKAAAEAAKSNASVYMALAAAVSKGLSKIVKDSGGTKPAPGYPAYGRGKESASAKPKPSTFKRKDADNTDVPPALMEALKHLFDALQPMFGQQQEQEQEIVGEAGAATVEADEEAMV